jgi:hypothetical protein
MRAENARLCKRQMQCVRALNAGEILVDFPETDRCTSTLTILYEELTSHGARAAVDRPVDNQHVQLGDVRCGRQR